MPRVPPVEEATVVAAPTAAVWRAIIDGCDRARWWADLAIEPETRGRVTERWTDDSGVPQLTRGEVVACDEGRLLHFRWADEAWEASTDVELRLEPAPGGTRVIVREFGWERVTNGAALADEHGAGWRMHLAALRRRVEDAQRRARPTPESS